MQQLLMQAQKMQQTWRAYRLSLRRGSDCFGGGGMVTATATGKKRLVSIAIKPEAVDPGDVEMLQDLVLAAVNEAMAKADEMAQAEMAKATGGMGLPGMF